LPTLILMEFADITGAMEHMFSHITEHRLIAPSGIITLQEETIIPIRDKEAMSALTNLTTRIILTDHTVGGSSIYIPYLKESENKRKGSKPSHNFVFATFFHFLKSRNECRKKRKLCDICFRSFYTTPCPLCKGKAFLSHRACRKALYGRARFATP
jgi:hypothetical protein